MKEGVGVAPSLGARVWHVLVVTHSRCRTKRQVWDGLEGFPLACHGEEGGFPGMYAMDDMYLHMQAVERSGAAGGGGGWFSTVSSFISNSLYW